jgi:HK97 family phage major capsid protein
MKTLNQFLEVKGISMDDFNKKNAEEKAGIFNELNADNSAAFKSLEESVENNGKEVTEALKELGKIRDNQIKELTDAYKAQGIEIKKLKEGEVSNIASKSIKESLHENIELLNQMAKGKSGSFSIKAPADMTLAGNVTGQVPQAERIVGLNTVASRQVRLLDIVRNGSISSNLIEWVYQANKDGSAGVTGEGLVKNQIDFDMVVGSQKVEKVTAYVKVTTEMLSDITWIETEIRNELTREVMKAVEAQIYSGTGVSPQLNGYRTVSTAFTGGSAAGTVDSANEVDVLSAAALQIEEANQPMPNYHLVHPSTLYAIKSLKVSTSDRRYVEYNNRISIDNDGTVRLDGIVILSSTLVTSGDYMTGHFEYANLLNKEGLNIQIGLDSDDFTKNFRTILAEWRGVSFIKNNDRPAFVSGDFTTDKAVLETP